MIATIILRDGSRFQAIVKSFHYDDPEGEDYLVLDCADGQVKAFKLNDLDTFSLARE